MILQPEAKYRYLLAQGFLDETEEALNIAEDAVQLAKQLLPNSEEIQKAR